MLSGSCSHHIFFPVTFSIFLVYTGQTQKPPAVLFEEFSVVNDPFYFLDESWILL